MHCLCIEINTISKLVVTTTGGRTAVTFHAETATPITAEMMTDTVEVMVITAGESSICQKTTTIELITLEFENTRVNPVRRRNTVDSRITDLTAESDRSRLSLFL